jgi:peptide/nickel transport system permease protein
MASVVVMFSVAVFAFILLYLTPGDPAYVIAGEEATADQITEIRARLGLDRSFHVQLGKWLASLARGDLGESIFSGRKVTSLIWGRVEPSISLALLSTIIAVGTAIPLGVLAAWKMNTWIDRAVMTFSVMGFAVPSFVLGLLLMWVLGIKLGVLPVAQYEPFSLEWGGFGLYLKHLILPATTTGLGFMGFIARMTRSSMVEVLNQDYIRTARAKGLTENIVLFRHALRNAALPIITVIGLGMGLLISGLVVVETVFAIPGLGKLVVDALRVRDYPIIQGMILVVSGIYVMMNLIVDVLYAYFDPRIKY